MFAKANKEEKTHVKYFMSSFLSIVKQHGQRSRLTTMGNKV